MSLNSGKRHIAKAKKLKRRKRGIYMQARKIGNNKVVPGEVWPPSEKEKRIKEKQIAEANLLRRLGLFNLGDS